MRVVRQLLLGTLRAFIHTWGWLKSEVEAEAEAANRMPSEPEAAKSQAVRGSGSQSQAVSQAASWRLYSLNVLKCSATLALQRWARYRSRPDEEKLLSFAETSTGVIYEYSSRERPGRRRGKE